MTAIPMRLPSQATWSQIKGIPVVGHIICMPPAFNFYFSRCFVFGPQMVTNAIQMLISIYCVIIWRSRNRLAPAADARVPSLKVEAVRTADRFFLTAIGERWMFHEQYHLLFSFWFLLVFYLCCFCCCFCCWQNSKRNKGSQWKKCWEIHRTASVNLIGWKAHGPDHAISF
jgi:hypothetical protein